MKAKWMLPIVFTSVLPFGGLWRPQRKRVNQALIMN